MFPLPLLDFFFLSHSASSDNSALYSSSFGTFFPPLVSRLAGRRRRSIDDQESEPDRPSLLSALARLELVSGVRGKDRATREREGKGIRMDGEGYLKENGKKEEIFEKCKGFICVLVEIVPSTEREHGIRFEKKQESARGIFVTKSGTQIYKNQLLQR